MFQAQRCDRNAGGLKVVKQRTLYLRSVCSMDLEFYLKGNGIETQTAERISNVIGTVIGLNTDDNTPIHTPIHTLQCLTIHQIGDMRTRLTPEDLKTFKEFHYKYLLEYNKELRQSMQGITKSIEDLHNGNNRLPVVFWNKAAPYTV